MLGLTIRKRADKTGDTPGFGEPWPLAGIEVVGEPPAACKLPTGWVNRGIEEGWITLEGQSTSHAPAGPASNPWRDSHTFIHAETVVIGCTGGDVRYAVTHQPDKYADDTEPSGYRVDWFYAVQLEA